MHLATEILHVIVHGAQMILELMGIVILLSGATRCLFAHFRGDTNVRLILAERISLALEFLMAGEILHTIVAQEIQELIALGAIIVFRAILTWENSHEIKELEEQIGHQENKKE